MKIYKDTITSIYDDDNKNRFIIIEDYLLCGWKGFIIVDTSKGVEYASDEFQEDYWIEKICECNSEKNAKMICKSLNKTL